MPKTPVNPPSMVKPAGYSHAFAVTGGRMLFMAGQVYREYFGKHYPAMTLVEVKGLYDADQGCMLEIEGIAAFD